MRFIGLSRRAFDMLCERATYRFSHGKVLGDHETVRNWIADSAAQLDAARLMTLHAAWIADKHGFSAARREISLIKFFGADALHDIVDRALQVHGALGYSTDLPLEAMYRFARGTHFYDGADELHRSVAARLILREYEAPPNEIPREHVPTRRAAARERYADVLHIHAITGGERG
jgi:acyl-CoA dehydrogenase